MNNKFIYEIPAIIPAKDVPHSWWGFCVNLDPSLAFKLRGMKISSDITNRFQRMGTEIIELHRVEGMVREKTPYRFLGESPLIQGVNVPGDAADLSLDEYWRNSFVTDEWKELRKIMRKKDNPPVTYTPHNIDTKDQAFCLLTLWLNWANLARYIK